ncbi:MAG: 4-hydroxy-tetrahydrodipicolinate reductase [Oscillospiraceae bacterium]|jgi:4-hydroxy-tetrahydrodipicolinate reductase|nr:4-hydroxy-tetrahydrodipicolinate reductase [Oscillospiraceae bacterium]
MIHIVLNGCNGRLCRAVAGYAATQEDVRVLAGIDIGQPTAPLPFPVYQNTHALSGSQVHALIDCSHPRALPGVLEYAMREKVPCVVATTGYGDIEYQLMREAARCVPVFYSANMAVGPFLLKELAKRAARTLDGSFDIEIVESHHNQKIDAPSGTAMLLADAINETIENPLPLVFDRHDKREKRGREIGMHTIRGGTITGEHTVIFAGTDEVIELTHRAYSKQIFAAGCLRAARFLQRKPAGYYTMDNLVAETLEK